MTDASDLGRRRELPQQVRANLFGAVLDAMTDGVMVVDDRVRLVVSNRVLRDTLVLPPNCHGQALAALVDHPGLVQAFGEVLAGGGPRQVEVTHKAFVTRLLDVAVVPLPDHDYWGHRALGVVRDITASRQTERAHLEFIANASHELRTPVASILGWSETLVDAPPKDPAKLRTVHDTIFRHASRLHTLLDQLLDLSQLDGERWNLATQTVDLAAVCHAQLAAQREAAEAAGLSVTVSAPEALPGVLCDRQGLDLVVGNLLQNAIKYTPTGGRVELRAEQVAQPGGRAVRLAVADSGIGIADEHQSRIFERFYRVDKGRARHVGGAGLGLAIVAGLVRRMGGTLQLHSAVGKGSTFLVTLPVARQDQAASEGKRRA